MSGLTDNPLWRLLPGNPIFVRVVEAAAKRTRHAMIRIGYLGVLVAVTLVMVLFGLGGTGTLTDLSQKSAGLFEAISYVQLGMACLLAPIFTAGAITQEKDNQTYNVLLATPLSNAQIVLGSLTSRLYFVLALLAGGIPVFLITQLLGGVPGSSILLSFMIAAATAIFTGAVAVAIAVVRVGTGKTIFAFYVVISLYIAIGWLLAELPALAAPGGTAVDTSWLTALHPFLCLRVVLNADRPPSPALLAGASWARRLWLCWPHYAYLLWTLGGSVVMVALGTTVVRYANARPRRDWGRKLRRWLLGGATRKPRTVWANPIAWREAATRASSGGTGLMRWVFLVGGLAVGIVAVGLYAGGTIPTADAARDVVTALLAVEFSIVVLVLCNVAASAITREREDGTFDLLLVTPITSRYYLWGKLRGLISFSAILLAVPVATAALFAAYGWVSPPAPVTVGHVWRKMVLPVMPVISVVELAAVMLAFCGLAAMIALTMSLKIRGTIGAVAASVGIIAATALGGAAFGATVAEQSDILGLVIAKANPYTAVWIASAPHDVAGDFLAERGTLLSFQLVGLVASAAAVGVYTLIIALAYRSMVRSFDMIVRRQSR
ncbi:MAG: ABC transporter permease [Planctomycetota bacterium]